MEQRYFAARSKLQQGYADSALRDAERGYIDSEKSAKKDQVWNQRFRLLRAEAQIRLGKPGESLSILNLDPPSGLPLDVPTRRKILQAQALCLMKGFVEGELRLQEAEDALGQKEPTLLAESALVRGRCAWAQSNLDLTQQEFRRAAQLAADKDNFIQASALGNLGVLLMRSRREPEAIDVFQELLELVKTTGSPILEEKTLGNLGECYAALGNWRQSIFLADQADRLAEKIGNTGDQEVWLIDLGKAHFALWDFAEAETDYLKALSIAQQRQDQPSVALCFHNLTLLALRQHDIAKADKYLGQGEALHVDRESLHFAFDEAKIAAERKKFSEAERRFQELLPRTEKDPLLHFMVQRDLGKVYWQERKNARADQMFRHGIATAEKALGELMRPEDRMSFMDQTPFYDAYIQFLVAQNRQGDALRVAERSRAQVLAAALSNGKESDPEISVARLQRLSKQRNETILTYFLTDEKTFLWVITDSGFKLFKLAGQNELFPQTVSFNREIQDHRDPEDSSAAMNLYRALIEPAQELIPSGSSIVIIPSKLLSLVNFEALVVPTRKPHYWIEDVDVQLAGSLALLAGPRSPHSAGKSKKTLLAIGAPVEATKDFPALKFAPTEMQLVQNHFPAAERVVVSGKDATPQAYGLNNPGQFRFVHLDTHGIASELNPLDSAIILSPGPGNSYKLHAQEIKDIPLHADLVTISSCYGAGTRWYQGEGIVGLAWAFLRAGAHQVIAALWEVDDASSPQLMDDFYGELAQGKSAAEALRDAKLKMLHSSDFHRHPYYWASLQLYTGS